MDIHGFLPTAELNLVEHKEEELTLRLEDSPETERQYPFKFVLDITWKLENEKISITYLVKNTDDKPQVASKTKYLRNLKIIELILAREPNHAASFFQRTVLYWKRMNHCSLYRGDT